MRKKKVELQHNTTHHRDPERWRAVYYGMVEWWLKEARGRIKAMATGFNKNQESTPATKSWNWNK